MEIKIEREYEGTSIKATGDHIKSKCFLGRSDLFDRKSGTVDIDIEEDGRIEIGCSLKTSSYEARTELVKLLEVLVEEINRIDCRKFD